jgi:WD40 repeat protein
MLILQHFLRGDHESKEVITENKHKGEIKCIIGGKIAGKKYLMTGSVDHTIKIWENDPKAKDVVQTVVGHAGTVQCRYGLAYHLDFCA